MANTQEQSGFATSTADTLTDLARMQAIMSITASIGSALTEKGETMPNYIEEQEI